MVARYTEWHCGVSGVVPVKRVFLSTILLFSFFTICEGEEKDWRDTKKSLVDLLNELEAYSQATLQEISEEEWKAFSKLSTRLVAQKYHKVVVLAGRLLMPVEKKRQKPARP